MSGCVNKNFLVTWNFLTFFHFLTFLPVFWSVSSQPVQIFNAYDNYMIEHCVGCVCSQAHAKIMSGWCNKNFCFWLGDFWLFGGCLSKPECFVVHWDEKTRKTYLFLLLVSRRDAALQYSSLLSWNGGIYVGWKPPHRTDQVKKLTFLPMNAVTLGWFYPSLHICTSTNMCSIRC